MKQKYTLGEIKSAFTRMNLDFRQFLRTVNNKSEELSPEDYCVLTVPPGFELNLDSLNEHIA